MIEIRDSLHSVDALAVLVDEANASPFIGSLHVDELTHLLSGGTMRFVYADDSLVGFGGWMLINANWAEAGPFFVSERVRGQGLGKRIIHEVILQGTRAGINQYAVTRNPAVKHMLKGEGFQEFALFSLPAAVQLFVFRKVSIAKALRFLQKRYPEPVSHFALIRHQSAAQSRPQSGQGETA
jgi:GNAT superfamily N-acetyltransferase